MKGAEKSLKTPLHQICIFFRQHLWAWGCWARDTLGNAVGFLPGERDKWRKQCAVKGETGRNKYSGGGVSALTTHEMCTWMWTAMPDAVVRVVAAGAAGAGAAACACACASTRARYWHALVNFSSKQNHQIHGHTNCWKKVLANYSHLKLNHAVTWKNESAWTWH